MILADRLNRIIEERQISKAEFARRIGVTPQYVLLLTGNAKALPYPLHFIECGGDRARSSRKYQRGLFTKSPLKKSPNTKNEGTSRKVQIVNVEVVNKKHTKKHSANYVTEWK